MNDRIRVPSVQVVNEAGTMLGEMPTPEAMRLAVEAGLDLVEVGAESKPPVCRIMDFGKVQYEQQKKQGGGAKHRVQLKQIRLRAKTDQHDVDFKTRRARQFLLEKHKVKFNVLFRGRENAHHDRGRELLTIVVEALSDVAVVEQPIKMEGSRLMSVLMTPSSRTGASRDTDKS
ncbi:MAG: translation initiation factor IF-3 [Planctomycetales bacterium]|nr:translation initiation factor IF-3 [Planctomycetales bacterium]